MSTLEDLSAEALARDPGRPAIEFGKQWYTWGDMRTVADRMNAAIDASGCAPDAPIAFVPRNRPSAIAALMGMIARGRPVRMIYAFQSPGGIARDIERLTPAAVVAAAEDFSAEVRAALQARGIAAIALEDRGAGALAGFERSTVTVDAPARRQIEILTSGTTGPPKQFAITYEMIAKHHVGGASSTRLADASDPPMLLYMPIGNISGIYTTLPAVLRGARAVLLDRFNIADWHDFVVRYRPERSGLPPVGLQMLMDADIPRDDLKSIKSIGTGAAPVDPTVQRAFEQRYGIPVLLSYGATEFGGPVTFMTPELHAEWGQTKFGSVGRPFAGAKLRVIDPETAAELPPGTEGILEVVSPRIGPDWIRTADLAVIDADGFMFHRGRADGAIMRGGFKLLPETIEHALLLHDAISVAGVVGIPDHRLGQVPAAAIQLKPGVPRPSIAELEQHLRNYVLATHIPAAWLILDDLPKTPSFKIDRMAVRRLFQAAKTL